MIRTDQAPPLPQQRRPHVHRRLRPGHLTIDPETGRRAPRSDGRGFGVVTADLNGDGKIDIFVANDTSPNFLFLNKGDGTFEDATESSGAAYDERGQPKAGMGVDAEDVDGDGLPELFLTDFVERVVHGLPEPRPRHVPGRDRRSPGWRPTPARSSAGGPPWSTSTTTAGPTPSSPTATSTTTATCIDPLGALRPAPAPVPLRRRRRSGSGWRPATPAPTSTPGHVGRGAAFGDLDDDGDIDIVVNHKDGPPAVLRNDTPTGNHWVRLELRGTRSNRDAIGARVEVVAGGRTIHRQRKGGVSLESSHDPRLLIGVGRADRGQPPDRLLALGRRQRPSNDLAADRTYKVIEPPRRDHRPTP